MMKEHIEEAEKVLLHTYNRYPIVLDHGDGVYLYDTQGKKYLDFGAGIAVYAFGYNNKEFNDALKTQLDKLIHTSNYFYNVLILLHLICLSYSFYFVLYFLQVPFFLLILFLYFFPVQFVNFFQIHFSFFHKVDLFPSFFSLIFHQVIIIIHFIFIFFS